MGFSCSALALVAAGVQPVAAALGSPLSLAAARSGEEQYAALAETLKEVGGKLEAKYAQHGAELSEALSMHAQEDKALLEATIAKTMSAVQKGLTTLRAGGSENVRAASFLQKRSQLEEDSAVEVSVAGVSQPGKSISKRVGRLAQKWYASSGKIFATAFKGLDQIKAVGHKQLQASLQHAADAKLHSAHQRKSSSAAAFMLQSTGAGGSVDVKLSADTAAWPVPSDLILDMQERSGSYLVEACTTIADSFASLAKVHTSVIRAALSGSAL